MHLSIPKIRETSLHHTLQYIKWSMIGILGPELVLFAAWRQYVSAQALMREVDATDVQRARHEVSKTSTKIQGSDKSMLERYRPAKCLRSCRRCFTHVFPWSDKNPKTDFENSGYVQCHQIRWSMSHGFYAGMGGFVFDVEESLLAKSLGTVPATCRLTLTARGVLLLYQCGLLPQISESEILDKSKADGLAKALACLQAGWMVIQVVARLRSDLPITLLEVNTIGHVFCALMVYVLWWKKPKWIKEPTKLEGDWIEPVAAFMYMSSKLCGQSDTLTGHVKEFVARSELSVLAYMPENTSTGGDAHFVPRPQHMTANTNLDRAASLELAELHASVQHPSSIQIHRWRLAAQAVKTYPAIRARFTSGLDPKKRKDSEALRLYPEMPTTFLQGCHGHREKKEDWLECAAEQLVSEAAGNWPDDDLLRGVAGLMMGMVLWFASMAFGAVHAAAWNCYFPSDLEAWLWRSSAIYITASGLLWLMVNMLSQCSRTIWWYWYDMLLYQKHWLHYMCWGTICAICGLAYIFARLYLVVEAFISLRSLPVAAYATPQWTNVIPHL